MLMRLICFSFLMSVLSACGVLQPAGTITDKASIQNQRAASAELALSQLQEIDTLIRLDNDWLGGQIESAFISQAADSDSYIFQKIELDFGRQVVELDARVEISDLQGNVILASVVGEILLDYNSSHLEWLPNIKEFRITSKGFVFDDGSYLEAIPELNLSSLNGFKSEVLEALLQQGNNTIAINAVPMGEVQVGASFPASRLNQHATLRHCAAYSWWPEAVC